MINLDVFISDYLKEPLKEQELIKLFKEYKSGNKEARDKIIEHNIRLVISTMEKRNIENYDKKDITSVGIIGLIKAVDTFDINKNIKFSTYASVCIWNEIYIFLRNNNKHLFNINFMKETDETSPIEKTIGYDYTLEEDFESKIIKNKINESINILSERNREILKYYFGFYNNREYKQHEIAKIFNLTQSIVSRIIKKELVTIRETLMNDEYFKDYKKLTKL